MSSPALSGPPVNLAPYVCQWCGERSAPAGRALPPGWLSWPVSQAWCEVSDGPALTPLPAGTEARCYAWTCPPCAAALADGQSPPSGPRREPPEDASGEPSPVGAEAPGAVQADPSPLTAVAERGARRRAGRSARRPRSEPGESHRADASEPPRGRPKTPRKKHFSAQLELDAGTHSSTSQGGEKRIELFPGSACARCDRGALMVVAGEPRCSWHASESLPEHIRHRVRSRGDW
jgi:hypothetical protein